MRLYFSASMGLFGGFRATFTSNKKKDKKKTEEIVCLRYVVGDFDNGTYAQSTNEFKPRPKSEYIGRDRLPAPVTVKRSESVQNLPPLPRSKPPPLPERKDIGEYIVVENNSDSSNQSIENNQNALENKFAEYIEIRLDDRSTASKISPKQHKSILKTFKPESEKQSVIFDNKDTEYEEKVTRYSEQSTLIFNTQCHGDDNYNNNENGEENFEVNVRSVKCRDGEAEVTSGNFKITCSQIKESFRDEEFKVNIVRHESDNESELSHNFDDDKSEDEFISMGFSKEAASIFFGGDVQPKPRPRRKAHNEEEC